MSYQNPLLRSLLEAPQNQNEEDQNQNDQDQTQDRNQEEPNTDADTQNTEQTDDAENQDNQNELEDPFADNEGDGEQKEDLSNPPDGLESPDATDDGASAGSEGEADEQNIQLAILPLSKLDRLTLKRKCFDNFRNLRTMINRIITLISDNEQLLVSEFREDINTELSELYNAVNGYMTTKFSYNNYEENAKNYMIFAAQLDELLKKLQKDDSYDIK